MCFRLSPLRPGSKILMFASVPGANILRRGVYNINYSFLHKKEHLTLTKLPLLRVDSHVPHEGHPFRADHSKEEMEHQHTEPGKIIENELFFLVKALRIFGVFNNKHNVGRNEQYTPCPHAFFP